jgi:methylamine dehydrogenase accessory protein MauD
MAAVLLAGRLALALVFAVAGVTKLVDLRGSRQAMVGFGLPESLAQPAGLLLPLIELAVALALIPGRTAWIAALAAAALLVVFLGGMTVNLLQGRTPDCHCFGQLHSEPIGMGSIARNGALLTVAGFVGVAGYANAGDSAVAWLGSLTGSEQIGLAISLAGLALIALQWWLLVNLFQQNGRLLVRLDAVEAAVAAGIPAAPAAAAPAPPPPAPAHGLPVGTPAPAFSLSGLYGETMTLDALKAQGNPTLLVFTSPSCGPCAGLMPEVARWQREARDKLTVALVARGTPDENRAKAAEHGLINVLLQDENEVADAYRSPGTPSAVLIAPDGTIAQAMAVGMEPVRTLAAGVVGSPAPAPQAAVPQPAAQSAPAPAPLPQPAPAPAPAAAQNGNSIITLGQPAPDFNLPDLSGKQVRLADLKGSETLLLFWNTGCGFCKQMLDDLKTWEADRPGDAPKIVVFSSGPTADIQAMGLRSTVIPDPSFTYGPRFGANGTPMAVLLDAQGTVASSVAAGAPSVLALAKGGPPQEGQLVPLQEQAPARNGNGSAPATARPGDPAPALQLQDVNGKTVTLSDFRGRDTLVLFWNTGCGFCQRMLPDLKAWEEQRTNGAPEIVVISSGSADDVKAMGLRSTVLLDPSFSAGPSFGANGTPMGVLLDAEGKIASDVAVGADAVLALAKTPAAA